MAAGKAGDGKPVADGGTVRVTNRANQPRELRVRGRWYRWEPAGMPGDSVDMDGASAASADLAAYAATFHISKGATQ